MTKIMLIDDIPEFLEMYQEYFEERGYSVLTFEDGFEAVKFYLGHFKEIDIVITDWSMPRKSGLECINEILEINKFAKIIIASSFDKGSLEDLPKVGLSFIQKSPKLLENLQKEIEVLT